MNFTPLVSVIVPAYNATSTLSETLRSALAQTYSNIEVIVVDDGSSDGTSSIAGEFARRDKRLRLLQKSNGGVASARNWGIAASNGTLIAPLDADDLWHPTRIEKHVAAILAAPEIALVYSPFRLIDQAGILTGSSPLYQFRGQTLLRHMALNFIGNGSGILVHKHVAAEFGNYSTTLREMQLEGCEDLLLQLQIASRYRFAVVPEYLVGYRQSPTAMSANWLRMDRSRLCVVDAIGSTSTNAVFRYLLKLPVRKALFSKVVQAHEGWSLVSEVTRNLLLDPGFAVYLLVQTLRKVLRLGTRLAKPERQKPMLTPFYEVGPQSAPGPNFPLLTRLFFRVLELCEPWQARVALRRPATHPHMVSTLRKHVIDRSLSSR